MLENLFKTVFDDPLLFAAIIGDNEAHSEYIILMLRQFSQAFFSSKNSPLIHEYQIIVGDLCG